MYMYRYRQTAYACSRSFACIRNQSYKYASSTYQVLDLRVPYIHSHMYSHRYNVQVVSSHRSASASAAGGPQAEMQGRKVRKRSAIQPLAGSCAGWMDDGAGWHPAPINLKFMLGVGGRE